MNAYQTGVYTETKNRPLHVTLTIRLLHKSLVCGMNSLV